MFGIDQKKIERLFERSIQPYVVTLIFGLIFIVVAVFIFCLGYKNTNIFQYLLSLLFLITGAVLFGLSIFWIKRKKTKYSLDNEEWEDDGEEKI